MREERADAWHMHKMGHPICITTNPIISHDGLVMGRGIAAQAANRWPPIRRTLAALVKEKGNRVFYLRQYNVFSFPVKHHWAKPADLDLIRASAIELQRMVDEMRGLKLPVYLPRPGCGNGRLLWDDVRPEIEDVLSDDIVVVTYGRARGD